MGECNWTHGMHGYKVPKSWQGIEVGDAAEHCAISRLQNILHDDLGFSWEQSEMMMSRWTWAYITGRTASWFYYALCECAYAPKAYLKKIATKLSTYLYESVDDTWQGMYVFMKQLVSLEW